MVWLFPNHAENSRIWKQFMYAFIYADGASLMVWWTLDGKMHLQKLTTKRPHLLPGPLFSAFRYQIFEGTTNMVFHNFRSVGSHWSSFHAYTRLLTRHYYVRKFVPTFELLDTSPGILRWTSTAGGHEKTQNFTSGPIKCVCATVLKFMWLKFT